MPIGIRTVIDLGQMELKGAVGSIEVIHRGHRYSIDARELIQHIKITGNMVRAEDLGPARPKKRPGKIMTILEDR